MESSPSLPYDSKTAGQCTWWIDYEGNEPCGDILGDNLITLDQFRRWVRWQTFSNPLPMSLAWTIAKEPGGSCEGLEAGKSYCVEAAFEPEVLNGTPTTPSITVTELKPSNGIETPQPTQPDMVDNCDQFYFVQKGDGCSSIAYKYGIIVEDFQKWNPSAGHGCGSLWADAYACVSIIGHDKTPTQRGNGLQTPSPTQPEIIHSCNKFHHVQPGQSCLDVANENGITTAYFPTWNRGVRHDCSGLWANAYACVSVIQHYTFDSTDMAGWTVYDGSYMVSNQVLRAQNSAGGKALLDSAFSDFEMEAGIEVSDQWGNAGFVFRASNPGHGVDSYEGYYAGSGKTSLDAYFSDFSYEADVTINTGTGNAGFVFRASELRDGPDGYNGYYAGIGTSNGGFIVLGRADGGWRQLRYLNLDIQADQRYRLKVQAKGELIRVFVGDMDRPRFSVRDASFANGRCGVRVFQAGGTFDNIQIVNLS